MRDEFDCLSPLDYRYLYPSLVPYLSESGFIRYKCQVELALVVVLYRRGFCSEDVMNEVAYACDQVTADEVYAEERRIGHDIRALVNCIQQRVSDEAKPFVHMTATSYDISDTANAARYSDVVEYVVIPALDDLHEIIAAIALRESETVQIGRTHGQHAVPITFGFAMAGYVSRLGGSIQNLQSLADFLPGKFSGAVGAYNASSLFVSDPDVFECEVLKELGLAPAEHSTQIVQPEPLARLMFECVLAAGVMADLANDMRQLQRSEIAEVGEAFGVDQVGSSTMAQKQNPISFENIVSTWKIIVPRILTVLMDQISEHQRDLTNSATSRTYGEILGYLVVMAKRLTHAMSKLQVNADNLCRNLNMQGDLIAAEPLYLILAFLGHSNAHEAVRRAAQRARSEGLSLCKVAEEDPDIAPYFARMTDQQRSIINQPTQYTGLAALRAAEIASLWFPDLD